jgi:ArsR family transcriptional regulator
MTTNPASIFDLQAELCAAMSNPVRIKIVHLLREGPLRVNAIAEILEVSQPTVSRNLNVLRNVGILTSTRQGTDIIYQVANPKIVNICEMMRTVLAERENHRSEILNQLQE